ncbi:hypothetical protein HaLaN_03317 [Haematococcus lacustris]|uniref:Uncharacterized protein n=1 Tax=Haematococcus lacustris TaxID=44745 RepID=A0A699YDZ4_HAELA|nr:hypothetical protein HaLaN_03317 [Haematococcus lacustris]
MNSPQPCEEQLDHSKPTRPEGWKPVRCRTAVAVSLKQAVRSDGAGAHVVPLAGPGHPWEPWQMGGQRLQRSPQHPAGRGEQGVPTGAVQVGTPSKASCQGQGVPSIGLQEAARPSTQGPGPAACSTVACVHRAMLKLLLSSEHMLVSDKQCRLQITQPYPLVEELFAVLGMDRDMDVLCWAV